MTANGLLVLDKPFGLSSRQALDRVRRLYQTRKAGFAGTLDPRATGVLVCALGTATRLLTYLETDTKRYEASVELGQETDTDDAEGHSIAFGDSSAVTRDQVEGALAAFRGPICQRPPAYSAISVGGHRLYAMARRGEAVIVPEREVTMFSLVLTTWQPPRLTLDIHCSKGTYIRALARDLGRRLGCYAYLAELRRTVSGTFTLEQARTLEVLAATDVALLSSFLLPLRAAVADLPAAVLSPEEEARIRSGQPIHRAMAGDGRVVLLDGADAVVAIGRCLSGVIQPEKVLLPVT